MKELFESSKYSLLAPSELIKDPAQRVKTPLVLPWERIPRLDSGDHVEIHNIKQKDGETIEDFMKRFKTETGRMKGAPECMRISGFMHGKKGPTSEVTQGERVSNRFTPLTRTSNEILATEASKFQPPPPIVTPVEKRSSNKFCDFHNDKGHSTDECMQMKKQIEEAREIAFPQLTANNGTEGPLVIEAEMGGHVIHRVYIDGGSSMEILYEHCFNRLRPEIKSQMVPATTSLTGFSVKSMSPYNGIIGRPGLKAIQAVPSTVHGMLKFPVEGGIATICSTILIPTECASVTTSSVIPREERASPINFTVALHPDFPDQEVVIRGSLSDKGRIELCSVLKKNLDIFAWQPSDMTGVPRSVAEHRLNIREGYTPVRQKKRGQAPERARAIQAEVQKMVDARIMREVYYHDWLSNPVMVRKYDGSWRMCVDFTDLNRACPLPSNTTGRSRRREDSFPHRQGVYCYTKMPFGLKNAGATYQRLMDKEFESQVGRNIEVYVDDLVVKSHTEAEMVRDIEETFRTLRKVNMKLNPRKCSFGKISAAVSDLKKCIKKSDFRWTAEAEQAFQQLKQYLSELPLLVAPKPQEELIMYLSATYGAVSAVLMTERGTTQTPIYFISRALQGPELNYSPMENWAATKMKHHAERAQYYIHTEDVATQMGVKSIQVNVDSKLVANQVLGTYVAKEDNMIKYLEIVKGLVSGFTTFSISQVPRSKNKQADALSKIASTSLAHLSKQVLVEVLENKSIKEKEVAAVIEEDGPTWMAQLVDYLKEGVLPGDNKEARKLRLKARKYELIERVLYRRSFLTPWLRCVGPLQANYVMREIHEGSCSMHAGPRSVVAKAIRLRYYWPTMHKDARDMIRKCNDCQIHRPVTRHPQQSLTPITAPWPFYKWGIDIADPFPEELGKVKFLIVAMDYFTKWIEAKAVAAITGGQVKKLVWDNIVCRFVIPTEIGMPTFRTAAVDVVNNDKELRLNLDLQEECRERATVSENRAKSKMIKYYNARVRGVAFKPGGTMNITNLSKCQIRSAWPRPPAKGQDPGGPPSVQTSGRHQTGRGAQNQPRNPRVPGVTYLWVHRDGELRGAGTELERRSRISCELRGAGTEVAYTVMGIEKSLGRGRRMKNLIASHGYVWEAGTVKKDNCKVLMTHCPGCSELLDEKGKNIFHVAVENKQTEVIKFIYGDISYTSLVNQKDNDGNTPIHLLMASDLEMMEVAMDYRVNINVMNNEKLTPLGMTSSTKKRKRLLKSTSMQHHSSGICLVLVHWIEIQVIKAPFEPESVTLISRLDLSDPLHLHPNDSATLTIVSVKLKGTENYQICFCAMMLALEGKNKIGFIDGSCRRSNVNEVLGRQWDRVNAVVLGWILNSISEELFLEDFKRHNQLMKLMQFLMGLDNSYMQIRSSILSRDPLPDVRGAYAIISSEESHRVVSSSNSRTSQRSQSSVFNSTVAGVIVDSGSNQHLTYTDKLLVNVIDISKLGIKVSHPMGLRLLLQRYSGLIVSFNENKCFVLPQDLKGMAKQTREPFPLSEHKSFVLAELVHLDLWGPYKVTSKEGFMFFLTIVDDYSRLPSLVLNEKSPFDLVFNMKPVLKHLRVFGCLCFATVLNGHDKFGNRAKNVFLLVMLLLKRGYKLFSLERKQFVYSRDVKVFEKVFPFKIKQPTDTNLNSRGLDHVNFFNEIVHENLNTSNDVTSIPASSQSDGSHHPLHSSSTIDPSQNDLGHSQGSNGSVFKDEEVATSAEHNAVPEGDNVDNESVLTTTLPHVRRSERTSKFPSKYNEFIVESKVKYGLENFVSYVNLSSQNKCFSTELNKSFETKNFHEATKDPHWIEAMNNKMNALYKNDTWEITDLLIGRKAIGGKWVYKIKYKSNGDIDRYKARYVAKGFNQKEGIDFDETFSPVVKIVTVRCVINLAVQNNWSICQLDVNNAFLYGDLDETVYMTLPEGYFNPGDNRVCRLKKSLYGLKQAPKQWNAKLTQPLVEHGFNQSKSDYSLFTKSLNGKFIALLIYVDDIIITGNNSSEIEKLKAFLNTKFMIKDLGRLKGGARGFWGCTGTRWNLFV
uniref:Ribonuclease H-like domain-containing protein n=1 Tax=Tanacetum cinerariifolium TaxID=118510 RepID=A0A6L2LS07_TANCI|nr:ribonuclease H-like domain-containing protein [Tanacetum cinerariifolium]